MPQFPIALMVALLSAQVTASAKEPFTVRASIELPRLVDFTGFQADRFGSAALYSPDRRHAIVGTEQGDIARNQVCDSLLLFNTTDVVSLLGRKSQSLRPKPTLLAKRCSSADWGRISMLRWLNTNEVGFIAEGENRVSQAFVSNIETGATQEVTHSKTHVVSFDAVDDCVVFMARAPFISSAVMNLSDRSLYEILFWDTDDTQGPIEWFVTTRSHPGSPARLDIPTARLIPAFLKIWVSPEARYAVTFVPAADAPTAWSRYALPEHFGYSNEKRRSDPMSWDLIYKTRLALIDLTTGAVRPLLDAPNGWAASRTPASVFWTKSSVIISNTFLPLDADSDKSAKTPGIAEVDISTGEVTSIVADETTPAVETIEWDAERELLLVREAGTAEPKYLHRDRIRWMEFKLIAERSRDPVFIRDEDLNERPRLRVHGGTCRCSKVLFDPAPSADAFRFVQVRSMEFTDRNGISWKAALLLPPDQAPQRRYSLVVQTHGLRMDEFLIDGPYGATSAMAAQPLANAGLAVLQVEDNAQADQGDESGNYAEGYRAAIQRMVDLGIADPDRIGITAFSRTGLAVIRLLADHPSLIAAATIADAGWWGYVQNLLMFNGPQDAAEQYWSATGGDRSNLSLSQIEKIDPLYRVANGCSAVRIEANGPAAALTNWENFFLLARAKRPVDMLYFPQGRHVLLKPAERLASQGGTVDWYRFWLLDDVDATEGKRAMYSRWRELASKAAICKRAAIG